MVVVLFVAVLHVLLLLLLTLVVVTTKAETWMLVEAKQVIKKLMALTPHRPLYYD